MSRVSSAQGRLSSLLCPGVRKAAGSVEAAAFWATVLFPLVYLGAFLVAASFPDHAVLQPSVLVALLASKVLALVVGHRYQNDV